jgi:hypothetical protein
MVDEVAIRDTTLRKVRRLQELDVRLTLNLNCFIMSELLLL